jgi:hypothetical protein
MTVGFPVLSAYSSVGGVCCATHRVTRTHPLQFLPQVRPPGLYPRGPSWSLDPQRRRLLEVPRRTGPIEPLLGARAGAELADDLWMSGSEVGGYLWRPRYGGPGLSMSGRGVLLFLLELKPNGCVCMMMDVGWLRKEEYC